MNDLEYIGRWFASNTDGDWEQENTLVIRSLGNPGWDIVADLRDTNLEDIRIPYKLQENDEDDWWMLKVENGQFIAGGDLGKLTFVVGLFRHFLENEGDMSAMT